MTVRKDETNTICPIARSAWRVGDRWTILIVRELFMGVSRFDELQAQTEATPQMLAARLKRLESDGLIERRAYSERPLRYEYLLTEMGREFYPVILALRSWGERWCKKGKEKLAVHMTHRGCGGEVGLDNVCKTCGSGVPPASLAASLSPQYARERARRA
ncbi:MAG: helix-turn-helix transcriptional regulator, partial [Alphaproteobacteria bacterium]|nr:helix-turn-helix transcriptional regulator [Alphaproteobacteria bacterium]MDX5414830.1 helix-turn-helix transcriptional regulator [Alphaproteobacteria bacterium]MDX5492014.1 helix-turn-helix transcriptional regulator [Alphaproteobacteria bacterium]